MCPVLGTMVPPPGVGGSHPCGWPGPWNSLRNGLFPSGVLLEVIVEQSCPFQNLQMRLAGAFLLDVELLVQQCIILQFFRTTHIYKTLLISSK